MMLYTRRKRLAALAEREARGESFWTEAFDQNVRVKLTQSFLAEVGDTATFGAVARNLILHDEGIFYLVNSHYAGQDDLLEYLKSCDHEMVPTVVEAMALALSIDSLKARHRLYNSELRFAASVNIVLREHRVAFELINGEMVSFASRELHQEVVAPALSLLRGAGRSWRPVEDAYRAALGEISEGKGADAVTDAGTALQEALTVLGCEGNALGPLIKSARKKDILAAHDQPMVEAIEKIMHWVSADRSESGDAHGASKTSLDDAWLIVHVVGALLLRLSKQTKRGA